MIDSIKVNGRCPACGEATLMLSQMSYNVFCSWHECPQPDAVIELLSARPGGRFIYPDNAWDDTTVGMWHWWMETASADFDRTVPKALEYGAHDLEIMGDTLAHFADYPRDNGDWMAVSCEMAVWFYVLGKISRLEADYAAKRPGKADTWFDIVIYAMMARRIQEVGRWG